MSLAGSLTIRKFRARSPLLRPDGEAAFVDHLHGQAAMAQHIFDLNVTGKQPLGLSDVGPEFPQCPGAVDDFVAGHGEGIGHAQLDDDRSPFRHYDRRG